MTHDHSLYERRRKQLEREAFDRLQHVLKICKKSTRKEILQLAIKEIEEYHEVLQYLYGGEATREDAGEEGEVGEEEREVCTACLGSHKKHTCGRSVCIKRRGSVRKTEDKKVGNVASILHGL